MNLDSPETWRWIWLTGAIVFAAGEAVTPGSFFSLPFAVGAAVAAVLAFMGVNVGVTFAFFFVVSAFAFAGFWKMGRRLERNDGQEGVGATRWVGQHATVVEEIATGDLGTVRIDREEWRAESLDGSSIAAGNRVVVVDVAGLRLVVAPLDQASDNSRKN